MRAREILKGYRALNDEITRLTWERTKESEKELAEKIKQRDNITKGIAEVGRQMGNIYATVLYRRYIDGLEYEEIARRMHYSASHTKRLRRKAVEKLEKIWEEKEK